MLVQVLHGGKYFNLLCTEAPNESQLFPLLEVSLHVGHHLRRTRRWGRGIGKLGRVGELQLLKSLYVLVAQGQELHVALLHRIWLLERSTDVSSHFPPPWHACAPHLLRLPLSEQTHSLWVNTHHFLQYCVIYKYRKAQRLIKKHPAICHQEITHVHISTHMRQHLFKMHQPRHSSGLLCHLSLLPAFTPRGNNSSQVGMQPSFPSRLVTLFLSMNIQKQSTPFFCIWWKFTSMVVFCTYRPTLWSDSFSQADPSWIRWMNKPQLIYPFPIVGYSPLL